VLDGAQEAIFKGLHGRTHDIDFADGNLIRFADDFLITARTQRNATRILQILRAFLGQRGLRLSDQKTKVHSIGSGFDFLSRHYEYSDGELRSCPSKNAIAKLELSLCDLIRHYRGGQKTLIEKINRKLIGWSTYHKVTEATRAFKHVDDALKTLLVELCQRLNPKMTTKRILERYFYRTPNGDHLYALVRKQDVRVIRLQDTIPYYHPLLATNRNPYIDIDYYEYKTNMREMDAVSGKFKAIWARQDGKCFYCGKPILMDEWKEIVTIDLNRAFSSKNSAYVHKYCSSGQYEFYESDEPVDTPFDLHELLLKVKGDLNPPRDKRPAFAALNDYFRQKTEAAFTLSFKDVEGIIDRPLCNSAKTHKGYWYMSGESRISFSWLSNGYKIRKLDLQKGTVGFIRVEKIGEAARIPEVFLSGRIPKGAKAELENFFAYLKQQYGL